MRRLTSLFVLVLLCACTAKSELASQPSATYAVELASHPTVTSTPSSTPYPVFNAASMATRTPAEPQLCPVPNSDYSPPKFDPVTGPPSPAALLLALNSGISPSLIQSVFHGQVLDLTGDGIAEVIYTAQMRMTIFSCKDGGYVELMSYLDLDAIGSPHVDRVIDMNGNGTPEVVVVSYATTAMSMIVNVLEWNGEEFVSLLRAHHGSNSAETSALARALYWYELSDYPSRPANNGPAAVLESGKDLIIQDTDGNGTLELILIDGGPASHYTKYQFGPWREKTLMFEWNGADFLLVSMDMAAPEYRFQAVQDADRLFLLQRYEEALTLYQRAIFDETLDWWSEEKRNVLLYGSTETPLAIPTHNPDEYAQLAAYAYFKSMLSQITLGGLAAAEQTYHDLLDQYPAGTAGSHYATLASLAYKEYAATQSMVATCAAVTKQIEARPDLLSGIQVASYTSQAHKYAAYDVCPIGFFE